MADDIGGQVHGIGLDSFLQMAQMEKTTCTLKVIKDDNIGHLYLLNGNLIDAETEELKSIEAAYKIIGWENAVIEIENVCKKEKNVINQPIMNILMEALKIRDEAKLKEKGQKSEILEVTDLEIQIEPTASEQIQADDVQAKEPESIEEPPEELELELEIESEPEAAEPETPEPEAPQIEIEPEALKPKAPEPKAPEPKPPAPEKARKPVPSEKILVDVDTELMEEAAKSKKKILTISAAAVGIILIVSAGLVYLITSKGDKGEYQRVLAKVENQQELEEKKKILQNFITSHDQSKYTTNADNKIKEIQNLVEERDFNNTISDVKKLPADKNFQKEAASIYTLYLAKYPGGAYSDKIKQKISEIPNRMDDMDYQKVKEAELGDDDTKIAAYSIYLTNHPQGKHHETVEKSISDMSEGYYEYLKKEITACDTQKQWDSCIAFCNRFMITFKNNKRLDEISALKKEMEGKRDLTALRNKADLKGDDYEAAKEIYLTYLKTNPDSSINSQIQDDLAMIDKKIQEKSEWEIIFSYSQNQQKDIFDRVQRLKKYMEQNPSEHYLHDA